MYCSECGTRRPEGAVFCPHCGARFDVHDEPPGPPPRRPVLPWVAAAVVLLVLVAGGVVAVALVRGSDEQPRAGRTTATARSSSQSPSSSSSASPSPSPSRTAARPTESTSPSAVSPSDFGSLYRDVSAGVVRIETTACDGGGVGSGFLVAPDLVATVAHVVAGSASVVVREGGRTTTGAVVGIDPAHEVALVRTREPLGGHVFELTEGQPEVGTDVGAIGYPLGGPESLTKGSVSGLGRDIDVEGTHLAGLIQTDAAINHGNSGGPLLTADGTVVGLAEAKNEAAESIGYAVPASAVRDQLGSWADHPVPVAEGADCADPTGPDALELSVVDRSGSPDGPGIAAAFDTYANGINTGDYDAAYDVLSAAARSRVDYEDFADGASSSFIVDFAVDEVSDADGARQVAAEFTSVQDPEQGRHRQSCSNWRITYRMVRAGSDWLIDRSTPEPGSPSAC